MNDDAALRLRDGCVTLRLDLRVYRLAAIQKAAYRLARKCTAALGEVRDDALTVALHFTPDVSEANAREIARLFLQELLDQELREKVREETASLRALLLAHAFARTDLVPER